MSIDYGYLLRYQQLLLAEISVINQVLVLDKFDTVDFPDEVLEIVLDHVRLSKAGGRGSGDVSQKVLDRVSLFELCRLYYVEKIAEHLIQKRLGIANLTYDSLFSHYGLPKRPDMRIAANKLNKAGVEPRAPTKPEYFRILPKVPRLVYGLPDPEIPQRSDFVTPGDLLSAWGDKSARMVDKILSGEVRFVT